MDYSESSSHQNQTAEEEQQFGDGQGDENPNLAQEPSEDAGLNRDVNNPEHQEDIAGVDPNDKKADDPADDLGVADVENEYKEDTDNQKTPMNEEDANDAYPDNRRNSADNPDLDGNEPEEGDRGENQEYNREENPEGTFVSQTELGSGLSSEFLDIRQDTDLHSLPYQGEAEGQYHGPEDSNDDNPDQNDPDQAYDDQDTLKPPDDIKNSPFTPHPPATPRKSLTEDEEEKLQRDKMEEDIQQSGGKEDTELMEKGLNEEDTEKDLKQMESGTVIAPAPKSVSKRGGARRPLRGSFDTGKEKNQAKNTQPNGLGRGRGKAARGVGKRGGKLASISGGRGGRQGSFNQSDYGINPEAGVNGDVSVDESVTFPYKSKPVLRKISSTDSTNLPPPRPMADDDLESSGSDVMDPPTSYKSQINDMSRYEESTLRDLSNSGQNRQMMPNSETGPMAKGRRVMFFRNGDIHYKPKQVLISNRTYTNLEKLLVDLSSMVETSTGVKYIFSWPEGREIKSITEFENGKYYVCSSIGKLQRVDYGNSKENHWKAGKIERHENFLFQKDGKVQSPLRRPRVLTIISNMYRDSREKLILNTNSQMNFEDILNDIVNMVNIPNPPVRALFTEKKPHLRVESYSQLIRDFADHENFIACGEEMVPLEFSKQPGQIMDGSVNGTKRTTRRGPRSDIGNRGGEESVSPTRSVEGPNANDRMNNKQQAKVRRRKTDSVRVDINGKTREFFPPTMLEEDDDGMKPDKKLRLDWVYGFRGRDVKQNLSVLPGTGELVYFVAAVVVVYDKKFATQKHYLGHSEEITCLTVHPNGRFIATGQTSGKTPDTGAHVRIWDGMSLSTYAVIGLGTFQQGISCVNFSEKDSHVLGGSDAAGELIMAIDDSDRHVLTVWEWQSEKMVARTTTTNDPVVSGCFYPFDESILVTYGKEHIHFWRMFWEKGRKIMRDKLSGNFEDEVPKFVTSICFSPTGDVITGDSSGAILVWTRDNNSVFSVNENMSVQTRKAHKKSVSSLCMLGDGTLLSGGGNEVKAWDSINNYSLVKERVLPDSAGHIRSIVPVSMGGLDGSIYVSTTRNKVLEGSLQLKFKFVIQGHVEELWAVESHPLEQTFISAGHDQSVVKWSAVSHAPVWRVNVENPCTSISIDPKGRLIALGTTAGKVVILNSYNGIQLTTLLSGNAQINALSFSPDGKQLAVGTFDGVIQIFYVQDEGHNFFRSQASSLKHNNMFIMHMDWSLDSKYIQAVLGDYDIVYWDITTMQKIKTARSLRDVKWVTHNCPIGHSIIGPWQNLDRGDVINVVSRSQYRDLMVVGDTKGRLRLYKWPCSVPKSGYRQTKVYSSNVTCATFTCDDGYVITSGGNDAALMQFSVLDPVNTR